MSIEHEHSHGHGSGVAEAPVEGATSEAPKPAAAAPKEKKVSMLDRAWHRLRQGPATVEELRAAITEHDPENKGTRASDLIAYLKQTKKWGKSLVNTLEGKKFELTEDAVDVLRQEGWLTGEGEAETLKPKA